MANGCHKNCITWRGVGLIIGWAAFIPMLPIFVFVFILHSLSYDDNLNGVTGIVTLSMIAIVSWLWGVAKYKPRCMLFPLIWSAFLVGYFFQDLKREIDPNEKIYLALSAFLIYILALFSYDFVLNYASRMRSNHSRINQLSTNLTQMNPGRYSVTVTAPDTPPNLTCEVPIIGTDDTKSLIMMVD